METKDRLIHLLDARIPPYSKCTDFCLFASLDCARGRLSCDVPKHGPIPFF